MRYGNHLALRLPRAETVRKHFLLGFQEDYSRATQDILNPTSDLLQATHGMVHYLQISSLPTISTLCCLRVKELAAKKSEFAALEKVSIVCWADSQWASPLHMVR